MSIDLHGHSRSNAFPSKLEIDVVALGQESTIYEVDFGGHVVIFGISGVQSLFHLIAPLRVNSLKRVRPVVLVDCRQLDPHKWNEISMFQAVYFFQVSFTFDKR